MALPIVIKKIWSDSPVELIDKLKRTKSSVLNSASYIVFKASDSLVTTIRSDQSHRLQILDRSAGLDVYLLCFDKGLKGHVLYRVIQSGLESRADKGLLEEVRSEDLSQVIQATSGDCIIEAPPGVHFVTPSNKHTVRFLRLADALHSYNALDRISYWLQPAMIEAGAVLVDSWSLSSIVLRCQQLLGIDIPFDAFRQHIAKDERGALETIKKLESKITTPGDILVLISISSSGMFAERVRSLIDASNISNKAVFLSLYKIKTAPQTVSSLSELDIEMPWQEEVDCAYCHGEDRRSIHLIDPKFYYPREYKEETINFAARLVCDTDGRSETARFIDRFGAEEGVLRVHRDDPNDGRAARHHAFYIDVDRLLSVKEFRDLVINKMESLARAKGAPEVAIIPPHAVGQTLESLARDVWKSKVIISPNLKELDEKERGAITSSKHICVFDDAVVTGSRYTAYVRSLRESFGEKELQQVGNVTWFSLLMRPECPQDLVVLKSKLSKHSWKDEITWIFKIFLPNINETEDCPWCREIEIYAQEVGAIFEEPDWYRDRRDVVLQDRQNGVTKSGLFVLPGIESKTLGCSSPLAPEGTTSMQLMFLIAHGLQLLRHDASKQLGRGFLGRTVLDSRGVFERFSEPLIQSVFLRLVKCSEWDRQFVANGLQYLAQNVQDNGGIDTLGELLLYLHRCGHNNGLPPEMVEALAEWAGDPVIAALVMKFWRT